MDEIPKFLEFALKGEVTTPGGWLNLAAIGLGVLVVSGAETGNLLMQLIEAAGRILDRLLHFIEKMMEFLASILRAQFYASPKPEPYRAPRDDRKVPIALIVVGVLGIACVLALGAARYPVKKQRSTAAETQSLPAVAAGRLPTRVPFGLVTSPAYPLGG